jgi:hypothetical protein
MSAGTRPSEAAADDLVPGPSFAPVILAEQFHVAGQPRMRQHIDYDDGARLKSGDIRSLGVLRRGGRA